MDISDFSVEVNEDKLSLSYKGETVRTVSPLHSYTYKFKIDKEEFFFLYEENKFKNNVNKAIYLFPVNLFTSNKISIK